MRVAFAGSGEFAVPSLRAVARSGHAVALVLTAPNRLGDRGRAAPRPIRDLALELGLPLAQPERLTPTVLGGLGADDAELLVVCDYGQLIPAAVLQSFSKGAVGVHPSLLPKLRGAAPIPAAILAGDQETGVTIYQMDKRMDAGPILAQRVEPISQTTTTPSLSRVLAQLAADLLVETLAHLDDLRVGAVAQDENRATYTAKAVRSDGELSWDLSAERIDRMVRALQPWPGTVVRLAGGTVKVLAGHPRDLPETPTTYAPGTVLKVQAGSALVATGDGAYELDLVQPPGRTPMAAASYLRGRRIVPVGRG